MSQNNSTIFQKLTNIFGYKGKVSPNERAMFNFSKDELLRTDNKEEYNKALLQAQQSKYNTDKWVKLDQNLYNQSIYNSPNRLSAYFDFENMEYMPEISSALDTFSEESCLGGNTIIPLLNGEFKTIKELYDENYKDFWVYGLKINENEIKPSKVKGVISKGIKDVFKITLDDGSEIIATDNHKWLLNDNTWIETKDLTFGSSLKSIYRKIDYRGYEKVSTSGSSYKHTHTIVANDQHIDVKNNLKLSDKSKNNLIIVHHKSFNKLNNDPSQLEFMFWDDHQKLHTNLNRERWDNIEFSTKMRKIFSLNAKTLWLEKRDVICKKMSESQKNRISKLNIDDRKKIYGRKKEQNGMFGVSRRGKLNPNYNINKLHLSDINEDEYIKFILTLSHNYRSELEKKFNLTKQSVIKFNTYLCDKFNVKRIEDIKFIFNDTFNIIKVKNFISQQMYPKKSKLKFCNENSITTTELNRFIKKKGYSSWSDIVESKNHRVINIEYVGHQEVYDLLDSSVDSSFGVACNDGMIISHNCTLSEKGKMLTIFSESNRVRETLETLFEDVLDINTNLPMWTRGMCKYGDNFVFLKILPEKGVIGCQQLPNIEIERVEGVESKNRSFHSKSNELTFEWKNQNIEFQSWEIAHFRLLGDDRKLPYGSSILDKIRRVYKQLLMAEDAMLIYRISRAPERRVFKVFVGNMDEKDVEPYIQRVANKFKRDTVVDQKTGQVDTRYNQMSVDQDYVIPIRDINQSMPIETLPGASNLGDIMDIEYLQKKLVAALRVPKAFLGFEDVVGDGKSLALMDIRFARTINKIQRFIIQELNKIALIHLYMLGLEDELSNFNLSLTNPSAQSDLLRIEQWNEKITLYKDATSDQSQVGILPVSHTWAKKNILGMSDSEVLQDLQQQRLERAMGAELLSTQTIIRRTGVFDNVDSKYGISEEERKEVEEKLKSETSDEMGDPSLPSPPTPSPSPSGGEEPLNEEIDTFSFNGNKKIDEIDFLKGQKNIYEINERIKKILND